MQPAAPEPNLSISVVVPAFNAAPTIEATLGALGAQDLGAPFEVVVVDDGSSDDTAERAARFDGVTVLSQENSGPGPARNLGAARTTGEAIAFIDADCVPEPDWLRRGLEALAGADLVQGAVAPAPEEPRGPLDRTVWVVSETGLYESANLFVRRSLFDELGGFEDWLGPVIGKPLAEDTWFAWRARRSGARVRFSERPAVAHAVFPRSIRDYAGERLRLMYLPAVVSRVPELRRTLLFGRVFLNRRTAAFDAAIAGAVASGLISSALPLLAALPWLWLNLDLVRRWRRRAPAAVCGAVLADLVGLVALLAGSLRFRAPVL